MKIRIYLRTIGIFIVAAFLAAMILGGILTFTVTRYTAENDKIYAFYDTFNPCIFFDHYPASLGSLLGLVIVCSASILYSMTLFVYSHICFPIDVHFVTAVAVMVMSISDVLFPNVFGVDLYEHGYTDYSSADSHAHRRLHGSLAFISSNSTVVSLSDADVQNINCGTLGVLHPIHRSELRFHVLSAQSRRTDQKRELWEDDCGLRGRFIRYGCGGHPHVHHHHARRR